VRQSATCSCRLGGRDFLIGCTTTTTTTSTTARRPGDDRQAGAGETTRRARNGTASWGPERVSSGGVDVNSVGVSGGSGGPAHTPGQARAPPESEVSNSLGGREPRTAPAPDEHSGRSAVATQNYFPWALSRFSFCLRAAPPHHHRSSSPPPHHTTPRLTTPPHTQWQRVSAQAPKGPTAGSCAPVSSAPSKRPAPTACTQRCSRLSSPRSPPRPRTRASKTTVRPACTPYPNLQLTPAQPPPRRPPMISPKVRLSSLLPFLAPCQKTLPSPSTPPRKTASLETCVSTLACAPTWWAFQSKETLRLPLTRFHRTG
jgi:hypothetical protein